MKNLIQAAVVTLLAASAAQAQQAVQWKVSDGGNGHWYKLHSVPSPWILARQVALSPGGDLCSLETDTERGWIALTISCALAYVGGYQLPGATTPSDRWTWLTGAPVSLPLDCDNNPCIAGTAAEDGEQDYLHSAGCWTVYGDVNIVAYGDCSIPDWGLAVFEWDADCSYDGVVDYGQCHDGARPDYDGNNIPECCERGEACTVGSYPVQWCVEDGGNGHWYDQRIWTGPKSIVDINVSYVAQVGAHAVTITSPSENEFVYRAVHSRTLGATHDGYSILGGYQDPGASDYLEPAGGWRWVTGEPMTYMNWGPGLPDNCCGGESVLPYPNVSYWNDAETTGVPAGHRYRVIVEWDADCNQDGIIDKGQILTGQLADVNTDGISDVC